MVVYYNTIFIVQSYCNATMILCCHIAVAKLSCDRNLACKSITCNYARYVYTQNRFCSTNRNIHRKLS